MPRFLAGVIVGLLLVGVLVQVFLPGYLEGRVEDRLTSEGGEADVQLSAFPALRLLASHGDEIKVEGSGLEVGTRRARDVLDRLDGFEKVDVALDDFKAGPLSVNRFEFERDEPGSLYRARFEGRATPREMVRFLGSQAGGALGGLAGGLAGEVLPGAGSVELPLDVTADVQSRDGEIEVVEADASVAGAPAGPLAELVVQAVVREL